MAILDISKHPLLAKCFEVMQAIEKCGASKEITDACAAMSVLTDEINKHVVAHDGALHTQHVADALGIHQNEPIFVLKARDPQAPNLVFNWAFDRERMTGNGEKISNARLIASKMYAWKNNNHLIGFSNKVYNELYHPSVNGDPLSAITVTSYIPTYWRDYKPTNAALVTETTKQYHFN